MRYVLYAFAFAAMVMVWANTSPKGQSVKRQLTTHPVDPNWAH
jgi:hypothetical protein